jgi:hypothetical protein
MRLTRRFYSPASLRVSAGSTNPSRECIFRLIQDGTVDSFFAARWWGKLGFLLWNVISSLSLITSILVPFGIFVHYWRHPDSFVHFPVGLEQNGPGQALLTVRRQIRRGRIASAVAFVVTILSLVGVGLPNQASDNWDSFLLPMMIATACIAVFLATPLTVRRIVGEPGHRIDMTPRSVWSFGRGWWFASWIVVAVFLVTTVVLAGLASSRDDRGRFAALSVEAGNVSGSTGFLGWYFGIPILIGVAALTTVTFIAIWVASRPPLAVSAERKVDVLDRRLRTRTILSLGGGALTLTLGWSLLSIGGGASMSLQLPAGELGTISIGTPLAALVVPLNILGLLLQGVGFALLLLPLFTRYPCIAANESPHSPSAMADISVSASEA